jgi:hypothetical protein
MPYSLYPKKDEKVFACSAGIATVTPFVYRAFVERAGVATNRIESLKTVTRIMRREKKNDMLITSAGTKLAR